MRTVLEISGYIIQRLYTKFFADIRSLRNRRYRVSRFVGASLLAGVLVLYSGEVFCQESESRNLFDTRDNFYLRKGGTRSDVPLFTLATNYFAADDFTATKIQITLSFVNDELQFIKADKKNFKANYRVQFAILKDNDDEIVSANWRGEIKTDSFNKTNSPQIVNVTYGSLVAPPGEHKFRIALQDLETMRAGGIEGRILVPDYNTDVLSLSDVWLTDSVPDELILFDPPHLLSLLDSEQPASGIAYFEIYNVPAGDSIYVSCETMHDAPAPLRKDDSMFASDGRCNRFVIEYDQAQSADIGLWYILSVRSGDRMQTVEYRNNKFTRRPGQMFANIEESIEQLFYIAEKDELREFKKAVGKEKELLLKEFWYKRDPSPGTPDNEYMEIFLSRVKFANENFTTSRPGWRTQMGEVYIKLGPPDYVYKQDNNTRYVEPVFEQQRITWSYMYWQRQVVFDYRGGEYRIANFNQIFDLLNDGMIIEQY
jgi:GWxTD domain-containing protein